MSQEAVFDRETAIRLGRLMASEAVLLGNIFVSDRSVEIVSRLVDTETSLILAEMHGTFLQRSWRPLMMLWFAALIGMWWFGVEPDNFTQADKDNLFGLLKLGIGGYVVGRSAEKVVPKAIEAFKK